MPKISLFAVNAASEANFKVLAAAINRDDSFQAVTYRCPRVTAKDKLLTAIMPMNGCDLAFVAITGSEKDADRGSRLVSLLTTSCRIGLLLCRNGWARWYYNMLLDDHYPNVEKKIVCAFGLFKGIQGLATVAPLAYTAEVPENGWDDELCERLADRVRSVMIRPRTFG